MRSTKYAKRAYLAYSAALILLGVCLLVFRALPIVSIARIIGGVTLLCGAAKFISYFVNDSYGLAFQFDFAMGIFTMLVGLILLLHPMQILAVVNVVIGLLVAVDGALKLQTAKEARHFGLRGWLLILLLAVLTTAAGVLLVLNPFKGISAMAILIGSALMVYGCENLCVAAYAIQLVRRFPTARQAGGNPMKGEKQ